MPIFSVNIEFKFTNINVENGVSSINFRLDSFTRLTSALKGLATKMLDIIHEDVRYHP